MSKKKTVALILLVFSLSNMSLAQDDQVLGFWDFYLPTPEGVDLVVAEFSDSPEGITGSFKREHEDGANDKKSLQNVLIEGNQFSFEHEVDRFLFSTTVRFHGTVDGNRISGIIDTPMGDKKFQGVRR